MAPDSDARDEEQIETTLAFDVEHYADHDPFDRVAEAVLTRGDREVMYVYDIRRREGEQDELQVHRYYSLEDDLVNESNVPQTYPIEDGVVYHTDSGQELREFIKANAFADPEISLTDEFESMVRGR